ncbi:hypothetical protein BCR34DRAFT_571202 [Clohesyomyces aquaticus]|uniref:Uncharacterized protein n=1 Tax=Clohesyomyces aquaticus TaxID=1231657 RepID=A0A1Y1Z8T0_9PLEO|nr:hypothetical protein BCR34DRAFT_571202 [Clohesyomyces aquaticus]
MNAVGLTLPLRTRPYVINKRASVSPSYIPSSIHHQCMKKSPIVQSNRQMNEMRRVDAPRKLGQGSASLGTALQYSRHDNGQRPKHSIIDEDGARMSAASRLAQDGVADLNKCTSSQSPHSHNPHPTFASASVTPLHAPPLGPCSIDTLSPWPSAQPIVGG